MVAAGRPTALDERDLPQACVRPPLLGFRPSLTMGPAELKTRGWLVSEKLEEWATELEAASQLLSLSQPLSPSSSSAFGCGATATSSKSSLSLQKCLPDPGSCWLTVVEGSEHEGVPDQGKASDHLVVLPCLPHGRIPSDVNPCSCSQPLSTCCCESGPKTPLSIPHRSPSPGLSNRSDSDAGQFPNGHR